MAEIIAKKASVSTRNFLVILAISTSSLSCGYNAAVIGTTLGQPSFLTYMGLLTNPNATALTGAIVCCFYAGGVIGAGYGGWAADKWGRKNAQIQSNVMTVIGGVLQAASQDPAMFIVGRIVSGCGVYMQLVGVPLWMSELSPPSRRGMLVDIHAVVMIFGYVVVGWAGYGLSFYSGDVPFRTILSLQCVPPTMFWACCYWIPESPRWLILKGRVDEAHAILRDLHSRSNDPHDNFAAIELLQICKQAELDKSLDTSILQMIRSKPMLKRVAFAIVWPFMTTASGILVIANYGPSLYAALGYDSSKQLVYQGAWTTLTWLGNIAAFFLVDRFNRNTYAAMGLGGCLICLIIEAVIQARYLGTTNVAALQTGLAMYLLYAVIYGMFLDGMLFIWLGEVFPTPNGAKGMRIGLTGHALFNIAWLGATPTAVKNIGWQWLLPFIIISFLSLFAVFFIFPNTRGIPLEEVAAIFGDAEHVATYLQDIQIDESTLTAKTVQRNDEKIFVMDNQEYVDKSSAT